MLTGLRLHAFGVVEQSEIDLGPGLTALTGETGAGKTMLVSGLGHLLGARGDSTVVRRGSAKAVVEGRWGLQDPELIARVEELGGVVEDGELLTLRQVSSQGRSRAVLGGVAVPVSTLAELLGEIATIHGQSEQLRLASPDRQRELLDAQAQPRDLRSYRVHFGRRRAAAQLLAELEAGVQERLREAEMLRFGLAEIEAIDPASGEDSALAIEQTKLMDVDELRELSAAAHQALSGTEEDFDSANVVGLSGEARAKLGRLADRDEQAKGLAERAAELVLVAADLSGEVASYLSNLVADPIRLEVISQRRAQLLTLTRKYGTTIDEVLRWAQEASQRLSQLGSSDERIGELRLEIAQLDEDLTREAKAIGEARRKAAAELEAAVQTELGALAMPHAQLKFAVSEAELGPHGADRIELLFSANPGSDLAPLAKVASGGELSRVRLALEVVLAAGAAGHTFVFDEVDSGVGGLVGLEIGRRLQRLARHSQVIVVTHLAQVAAFADAHFVVAKASEGQVTTSGVRQLSDEERTVELARMMGSAADSETARQHAIELLEAARRTD